MSFEVYPIGVQCVCVCVCSELLLQTARPPAATTKLCTRQHLLVCVVSTLSLQTRLCLCVCVYSVYVSPHLFSPRTPFNMLLMKSHGKHECVCVCAVGACVCVPLVFLPCCLLSHGPNMGPSVQLTVSQHGRLVRQTCGDQI